MKYPRSHSLLLILACLVTLVVASLYAYMHHVISVAVVDTQQARKMVSDEQSSVNRSKSLVKLFDTTSADWAKIPGFFVPAGHVVTFIEALEALGPQAGSAISISSISADQLDDAKPGTIGHMQAKADVTGSWEAVMKTLELAEDMPYDTSIDHVGLDGTVRNDGKASRTEWHLAFDIQTSLISIPPK